MAEPPRLLGDRYEIGDTLGRGGMAEVHEGRDLRLGRRVAVKILRPDLARDPSFQTRFRREAQSAAALNHPNIVAVYDTGQDPLSDGPQHVQLPYIVMEYVDGMTLRQLQNSGRRLLPERALEITAGVLAALDYSHRHGIVHRDIKPGNVMLTRAGEVKVMDFGIARALADAASTMTAASAVLGTAQYLSPEQARGEVVDARSDLYSTGCLLYELLTGRPPFVGDSPVSVAYQHVSETPLPPSRVDPEVPPELDAIVLKALAKSADDRYQSATEMKADIERALAGLPVTAAIPVAPGAAVAVAAGSAAATQRIPAVGPATAPLVPVARRRGLHPGWVVGIIALVLLAVGIGGFFLLRAFGTEETVAVPRLAGLTETDARVQINNAGLSVGRVDSQNSDTVAIGVVISSDPSQGEMLQRLTQVDLVVSIGKEMVVVPRLVGLADEAAAEQALLEAKLALGNVRPVASNQPEGTVVGQNPDPGEAVDPGTVVNISVSNGEREIPNVIGKNVDQATAELIQAGFDPVVNYVENGTVDPGTVTGQAPIDTSAAPGSSVTITVAKAPPPPTSPPPSSPSPPPSSSAPPVSQPPSAPVSPSP